MQPSSAGPEFKSGALVEASLNGWKNGGSGRLAVTAPACLLPDL
jgi:hypothetical protein